MDLEIPLLIFFMIVYYMVKYYITINKSTVIAIIEYILIFVFATILLYAIFPNLWGIKSRYWYSRSLLFFIIPTISFIIDLSFYNFHKIVLYTIRSVIEILILIPLNAFAVYYIIFNFGWVSI